MSQFRLDPPEIELFRELRLLTKDAKAQNQYEENLLQQTLNIVCYAGDRKLGSFDIDASLAIIEMAALGAKVMGILKSKEQNALTPPTLEVAIKEELDSMSDTQSVVEEQDDLNSENEDDDPPWEWFQRTLPSYVEKVALVVDERYMTANHLEEVKIRYPGAVIRDSTPLPVEEAPDFVQPEVKKPRGIKRAYFEVDQAELEKDPQLSDSISKLFPWVSLRPEQSRSQSRQRETSAVIASPPSTVKLNSDTRSTGTAPVQEQSAKNCHSMPHRPNSIKLNRADTLSLVQHRVLFSRFMSCPPSDTMFGYAFPLKANWKLLSPERKKAIAHARCIQGESGESVVRRNRKSCTSCMKNSNQCRVYRQFMTLANVDSGDGCQHCRLWNRRCDFADPTPPDPILGARRHASSLSDSSSAQTPTSIPGANGTYLDGMSIKGMSLIPDKPSLAERISFGPAGQPGVSLNNSSYNIITTICQKINLKLARKDIVQRMYDDFYLSNTIRSFHRKSSLSMSGLLHYYENLVALCIIGNQTEDKDLEMAAFTRCQETNYTYLSSLPTIHTALMGFAKLPSDSPLCQWIVKLFAYSWDAPQDGGEWENFWASVRDSFNTETVAEFLYRIAYVREISSDGYLYVLESPCDFHEHPMGGYEELNCKRRRDEICGFSVEEEIARRDEQELEEADALVGARDGSVSWPDSSATLGKRRASPMNRPSLKRRRRAQPWRE
jgi:hypothetical protein